MLTMSTMVGIEIFKALPTSNDGLNRWAGDIGLRSAIQQSIDKGLMYPISFLCQDPTFVSQCYENWAAGNKKKREVAQRLVPGAAKAYADGDLEGFRNWDFLAGRG
ncbi:hypothetical protein EJ02DRAFT_489972 [Clathrospora elynae]|uniref:Uncharacterized protein n=1 Tax=Clathrospora elynae TaxID=706981 RepID=A0A6A5SQ58_9PLEO|nr:hypothetical protein EJ02DRAFT_489972 [Clathrospora elynae]